MRSQLFSSTCTVLKLLPHLQPCSGGLISGTPGKPIPGDTSRGTARGRGAAEPQQCPAKGCSRGCSYLLGMLELDVEPTRLDHCLTSCPRSAPKKRPEPILLTSSVPALFRGEHSAQARGRRAEGTDGAGAVPRELRVSLCPSPPAPLAAPRCRALRSASPAAPLLTGTHCLHHKWHMSVKPGGWLRRWQPPRTMTSPSGMNNEFQHFPPDTD